MCPLPSTVMSISITQYFICARSVGPFGPPEKEKGVKRMFFLSLENCFLGLHGICSMSATNQYQLIWQVIFHSVGSSALWRGIKTRSQGLTTHSIIALVQYGFSWTVPGTLAFRSVFPTVVVAKFATICFFLSLSL